MFLGEHWGYLLIGIEHMSAELMAQCSRIWGLGFGSLCVVCPCGCECVCVCGFVFVCVCMYACACMSLALIRIPCMRYLYLPCIKGLISVYGLRVSDCGETLGPHIPEP